MAQSEYLLKYLSTVMDEATQGTLREYQDCISAAEQAYREAKGPNDPPWDMINLCVQVGYIDMVLNELFGIYIVFTNNPYSQ